MRALFLPPDIHAASSEAALAQGDGGAAETAIESTAGRISPVPSLQAGSDPVVPSVGESGSALQMAVGLRPVSLAGGIGGYDEDWLQNLLFAHPELIPMDRIEAGAGEVLPLCRELPIARIGGVVFLDMLGVTRTGRLVLVECKLWRNPQARREVVAQVIEYAGLMRGWSYGDLTAKLKQRCGWTGANPIFEHARTLWPDIEEASFVDRISRSLDAADFHLVIAGDGIRSDVEVLARQINGSGSKARLSLVEIQIWRAASGETVILPWLPVKTELIEQRVVVAADDGRHLRVQEVRLDGPNAGRDQGDSDDVDRAVNPERAESADRMRQFWNRFIQTAQFDHPEQPAPTYGGPNWVKLALGGGYRLTAYRVNSDDMMGVYLPLNLAKSPELSATLEAELEGMRQESGLELKMVPRVKDPTARDLLVSATTRGLSDDGQLAWLIDRANRMVTLLRPKLSASQEEAREGDLAVVNG